MQYVRYAALALLAAMVVPAKAAQSFDGSWSMSASTQSGNCSAYSFEVGISQGRIMTPPGVPVSGSGSISPKGRVEVQFVAGSDLISATGQARAGIATGRWNAPTLQCSGSWSAQKRT